MADKDVTLVTRNHDPFMRPKRVVLPRRRTPRRREVVAVANGWTVNERMEFGTVKELIEALPQMPPTLFVRLSAADFVAELDEVYSISHPTSWQWSAASSEREIVRGEVHLATRISTVVRYFGWKGGNYHRIIDPVTMYKRSLDQVWPSDDSLIVRLLNWAVALRDFCDENGIEVRPTMGSLGSQFLTDPRFYPEARRKVPTATNEQARPYLPGNYYRLKFTPSPNVHFTAHYLDQSRAHHYHAEHTPLPNANSLYAHGNFIDLRECVFQEADDKFYGLYCLDLVPPVHRETFPFVHGKGSVIEKQFIYSCELDQLRSVGYEVYGVRAAWGSYQRDTGIAKYARWAGEQLDRYVAAPWLKPILLATYGTLAMKPQDQAESIFRLAKRGKSRTIRTGHHSLKGTAVTRKMDPRIANVIHRGMIEAATRAESIGYANWLQSQGHSVLSIYADAVIVRVNDDKPLPPIPEPWRLKETLNHLQFINKQAFMSDSMTKLPGVNRDIIPYRQSSPGHAPRKVAYEALTGRAITTNRRI